MARPTIYTKEYKQEIKQKLLEYIDNTEVPVIAEFAYKNNILRQQLYEYKELTDTIKRCRDKKEAQLERLSLEGKINYKFAIFSLKQLGWKDRQEIDTNITHSLTDETLRKLVNGFKEKKC